MQIKSGELYENRTAKYLFPAIKHYGEELLNYINYFIKLGVGLSDENKKLQGGCIFILLDANPKTYKILEYKEKLDKFITWLKYQKYYVTDYIYSNKKDEESHMIVLDFPMEYNNAYIKFMLGRYSQMYTKSEIDFLFPLRKNLSQKDLDRRVAIRNVLLKEDESDFIKQVNKDFGTNISKFDIKKELDYPFDYKEEVFNFKD